MQDLESVLALVLHLNLLAPQISLCVINLILSEARIFPGVRYMVHFVVLGKWTDQGIRNVKDAPRRIQDDHRMVEEVGGRMELYYTMGECDFVMIFDMPNDEAMMKMLLRLGSWGNIRTKTLKAWSESEGAKAISQLE